MATLEQKQAITALYVGYFDRAPDPAGLQFWIEQIDNGREFNTIAADFAASDEAEALYPYLTTPDVSSPALFVENIYANLFGRTADDEGRDFWVDALESGSVSVGDMIAAIIDGARDDEEAGTFDKSILDNKVEVGLDFATEAGNTPGFEFDAAAKAAAVAAVNGVTEDEATVEAAKEATDAFVENGTVTGNDGDTFTLTEAGNSVTAGVDDVTGTANNDTFRAVTAKSLNSADIIDGGAGMDVLNISDGGIETTAGNNQPVIKNVERINNSDETTELDLGETTGLQQAWAKVADTGTAAFTNAKTSTTFGVQGVADGETDSNTITFAAGQLVAGNTVKLAVADVEDDGTAGVAQFNFTDAQAVLVENVTINAADDVDGVVTLESVTGVGGGGVNFDALETVSVTGAGDVIVTDTLSAALESVDASAATGDVNVTSAAVITADLVATGGTGDDTLSFANATGDLTLNGGAGADVLVGGAGDDEINGGAGADVMTGNGGDDAFTVETATIEDLGFDEITDFTTTSDTISFGGEAGSATNYTEAQATGTGFVTARSAAETLLAGDSDLKYVAIEDAGLPGPNTTYVFYDGNGDGKLDTDGSDFAVEIAGGIANIAFGDIVA